MWVAHTDGLSRSFRGRRHAFWAFVARNGLEEERRYGEVPGGTASADAEWEALLQAARFVHERGGGWVLTDYQPAVLDLGRGEGPEELRALLQKGVRFGWVPRERNAEADALTKKAWREFVIRHLEVTPLEGGLALVKGESGRTVWVVDRVRRTCTCPNFLWSGRPCKHLEAAS